MKFCIDQPQIRPVKSPYKHRTLSYKQPFRCEKPAYEELLRSHRFDITTLLGKIEIVPF